MHDVLSDPERRRVLYVLQRVDGQVPLDYLSALVGFEEGDGRELTPDDGTTVGRRLLLEHVLPMDRFGILTYDRDGGTVALSEDVVVAISPEDW